VVQVSGGALTRTSSVNPAIKIKSKFFGEIGSTQFLEQGSAPCSFFLLGQHLFQQSFFSSKACVLLRSFEMLWKSRNHPFTDESHPAQF